MDGYKQIKPEEIPNSVFELTSKIFPVVTVGGKDSYNSMVSNGGGMGNILRKPAVLTVFPEKRYTLELIREKQTYTLSYFPNEFKKQSMFFGTKSGRDSNKMQETELTAMELPSGNMSYKEANLIIECKLQIVSNVGDEEIYAVEGVDYTRESYVSPGENLKYTFGEIKEIWVKE